MEKRQKSTLRSQHIKIADELILDEDFYAALRRDKIFTNGMLDMIKAEATPRDRVYKLLELLEKRGPRAFENFVWILKENYDWLAKVLEEKYNRRLQHSPLGREMDQYRHAHYETQPRYMSNGSFNRLEEYHDSNNTAIVTPRQITIPTQETCSPSYNDNEMQQFFPVPPCYNPGFFQHQQQKQQQTTTLIQQKQNFYDSAQTLTISLPTVSDSGKEPKKKQYKDACISPIGIIESARKTRNTMSSPMKSHPNDDTLSETDTYDQGFDEILSETATAATSTTDDIESQSTSTAEVGGEGDDVVSENGDGVDGPENVDVALDEENDDFPTSEVYYEGVRRGSTRFSNSDACYENEHDMTRIEVSYEQTEAYQMNTEAMKALYIKFVATISDFEETEDHEETIVTWDMIETEANILINMLQNSDDMKMIQKCHNLFPSKDRRQPLNLCIEGVLSQKKELENRLRDKQGEIDQMVLDLWEHQQDMSSIKKLRKTLADYETENKKLKTSSENFVRDDGIKTLLMEEKDLKIQELEKKIKELQEDQTRLRPGGATRRGVGNHRRVSNAQGQSPRRQSTNFTEPRMPLMQGTYGGSQQSPRNVTTAIRRAPINRRIP